MAAIKRDPTPPGPISDLFNRLDQLHLAAGLPSMREIQNKAGRGNISSSTIHNVFRSSRVPRWGFLDDIVRVLGGDRTEFKALWEAAWRAEHDSNVSYETDSDIARTVQPVRDSVPAPSARIWSNEIPPRNLNFTGRLSALEALHINLSKRGLPHPPAQVISGMGGIGKTEIAIEYIHRHIDEYEIIWWIRAEHHDRVRDALVQLGQRLELRQATSESGRDRTIAAVLETLAGARQRWLLIFDNAAQPLDLQRYLPESQIGGHIIITSRLQNWPGYITADSIEVSPFTEEEAISFLRRRVPALAAHAKPDPDEDARRAREAGQLATALGHLPIAAEHAAAYLAETGQSVDEYLTRFTENAHLLLSEQPSDLPGTVSGTWAISTALLKPDAEHLFNLCAFFSAEPIAADLFLQDTEAVTEPAGLREFLASSQRFRAASSQLHRLSLAKVDGARDLIQVHRVVQAVTKGRLQQNRPDAFRAYRSAADILLAESNPGKPDRGDSDPIYDLSLQHLESDHGFLDTDNPALRDLIIDQVRRLHLRGAHVEAMRFGQDAMRTWRERLGSDHLQVLTMAVEVAIAMRRSGHTADAHWLTLQTRPLLQRFTEGDGHKVFLLCENTFGADLRDRSQFAEALDLDLGLLPKFEAAFGEDHERTLNVRNNIAADYRKLGRYQEALETDQRTLEGRRRILGSSDLITLTSFDAVARDLRGLGRYQESLDIARKVVNAFTAARSRENPDWLNAREGFAAALRKAGHHWDSLQESEHVVQRSREYLGIDHALTLRAAINLINDLRAVSDLIRAEELGREVCDQCREPGHPPDLVFAALVNLASVLRIAGRPEEALRYDEQASNGLRQIYGELHPFTLAVNINFAADLAACDALGDAIRTGQETFANCRQSLGDNHPDTLMAGANLSIDEAASGDDLAASQRLADVLSRYEQTLTLEHPEARAARLRTRITAEIEPY